MDFVHEGPPSLRLGLISAHGVHSDVPLLQLEEALQDRLDNLSGGLNEEQEVYRTHVRDVFRNGRYKPTGRGKPASEYLLRSAAENRFPRINTMVDICNYLSVASLLPISIWDVDRARTHAGLEEHDQAQFLFRLGAIDEQYVFNASGQQINLEDLIVGTVASTDLNTLPIVNAIKDSQATKTTAQTRRVSAAIYAPLHDGPDMSLETVCDTFCELLSATHADCDCVTAILETGQSVSLSP